MNPSLSPLRLDSYFIKDIRFSLNPGFDHGVEIEEDISVPPLQVGVVSSEQNPENRLQWRFELRVEIKDDAKGKFPFAVGVVLVGYFTVSEHYPSTSADVMAKANGPALLYSSARELVRWVTSHSSYPTLVLPSVTFVQPAASEDAERKEPPDKKTKSASKSGQSLTKKSARKQRQRQG